METRSTPRNIIKAYESIQREHQWFIEEESACPLCGSDLELHHKIEPYELTISEKAHCPACKITTKTKISSLQ